MKNLSLTQQYLLCVLKKNGKLPSLGIEKTIGLSASGVLELLMDDIFAFDGKKLSIQSSLPEGKEYLRPVYDTVERKQPVKFETIVDYFSVSFTDKHINELIDAVGESLACAGCVQKEKGGFFGGKNLFRHSFFLLLCAIILLIVRFVFRVLLFNIFQKFLWCHRFADTVDKDTTACIKMTTNI